MSNLATYLQIGDMVSLEDDPIFDPHCEFAHCEHKFENSQLVEIEEDGDFRMRMTFQNSMNSYSESVPLTHRFADPE
jgi:hypothetical protein